MLRCGPLSWLMDSHASAWPLKLRCCSPLLRCCPLSWADGLAHFGCQLWIWGDKSAGSNAALQLGSRTPMLRRGPSSWGDGLPIFDVAPGVVLMEFHTSVWPLEFGMTP